MEVVESRVQPDVDSVENSSSDRTGKHHTRSDFIDKEMIAETEKSRESKKHSSKDRKKERQEDYGEKYKDSSKHTDKDEIADRDIEKHVSKEKVGSREGNNEDRFDYGKERDELARDREKDRDKTRVKDYDWSKHREEKEYERGKDRRKVYNKEKDVHYSRERSIDREREQGRDHRDRGRGREKEKEVEKDRGSQRVYERGKEQEKIYEHDRDQNREKEKGKDKEHDRSKIRDVKDIDTELEKERVKERDRERGREREKERDKDRHRPKDREKEKLRVREKGMDCVKVVESGKLEKDNGKGKNIDNDVDLAIDQDRPKPRNREWDAGGNVEVQVHRTVLSENAEHIPENGDAQFDSSKAVGFQSSLDLRERVRRIKEDRLKKSSEGASEILSWVNKSRKLEEKRIAEKENIVALSRMLDEQDKVLDESEDEESTEDDGKDLAGVKILHGLDKVMEGGAVVLTLKDQNILADGDINDGTDMLENVEIGEQKRRDEAYRASKKKAGVYDDKFSDEPGSKKTILPQYDDAVEDEGVTLDESGRIAGEAEKKLAELRRRIEGSSVKKDFEDLSSSAKVQSDYFTTDEMLQFRKPKKKKSLRKRERLDLDALEEEAKASGLGAGDLGTRNDMKRLSAREEQEKSMVEARSSAYQVALAKAEEASKALRQVQTLTSNSGDTENLVFGEDYDDLQKSLEQARKLALKKKDEAVSSGPQAVALLASAHNEQEDTQSSLKGETLDNKVVITEMEEFVLGLQINEETSNSGAEDVFNDDEDVPMTIDEDQKTDDVGRIGANDTEKEEPPLSAENEDAKPDDVIHENPVGKGLSGALKLLKDRGTLKESIDWGGRNMDKKKSKLIGIYDTDGPKELRIERTDEFGRIMTPKEAFRMLSHKFHGKGPGKMKQEKRMKQYHEDLKTKQMKASDTPLLAMEKMREAQATLKTPYLVLSGHVKPGQTSDPRSGFATVEKDFPGSLTPMLGDKKVEHFLGIRSKRDSGSMGPPPAKRHKT
ncbi:hypothetical protein AXF42_Ash021050 [Apostasia shenzhenica]|uniref:SART-1 family protein DOT2 n=1 Tax=Apostasia shenzhenica TaxID=1088818 RepID=A0A2H9ZZB4_9ASPA|nr:hypothetical protein AXF42_Ash021050 [Apostasia shenzhenica]